MRMVIFEDCYYPSIWSELENRLGLSISDAMIRGQQASTWEYMENNILYGGRKYLLHRLPVNLLIKRIINETSLFGFGKVSVVKYERGKLLVMKVKYPFDIISVVWGVKGIFELVEGVAADLAWRAVWRSWNGGRTREASTLGSPADALSIPRGTYSSASFVTWRRGRDENLVPSSWRRPSSGSCGNCRRHGLCRNRMPMIEWQSNCSHSGSAMCGTYHTEKAIS